MRKNQSRITTHQDGSLGYKPKTQAQIAVEKERASRSTGSKKQVPRKLFEYYSDEEELIE